MAKRARSEEIEETDRIEGFPHPRETFRLMGQDEALARAARAIRSGRPPQGWLLTGPPGIGKATFAYRMSRYLLRYGATDAGPQDLSVPPNDPVSLQVAAGAHPGLLVLTRGLHPRTGKLMTETSVDVIRRLSGFFGMTSGAGGWRIAIVDTADDMSDQAANALLKALEEPPARSMLMLLSNAPGKLLPTIRSRCQRLDLRPLDETVLAVELIQHLPKMKDADRNALAKLAGGSLGAALTLADEDTLVLARDVSRMVDEAAVPNVTALFALADRVGRASDRLPAFGDFLVQALEERIRKRAHAEGAAGLRRWIEAWEQVRANFDRAVALHLEPRQTIVSSIRAIQSASRTAR
ncbi:MAG TPA: DNA polymerase III subunit delta' [Rhizomicrobium sp.]|jgi:DNA polymerase-3 subunit delta'|nr:DNA polymerase III subunit delta' [Rhizomicrobium sp.]